MLTTADFTYHKPDRTLVAELSDLELRDADAADNPTREIIPRRLEVRSQKTGHVAVFHFAGTDRTSDGEDVAGWRYRADAENTNLLIIND